jgi:hypothetical protein
MRKRIARHIESCPKCNDERHRLVTPAALLGAAPAFIPAPARLRQQTLDEIHSRSPPPMAGPKPRRQDEAARVFSRWRCCSPSSVRRADWPTSPCTDSPSRSRLPRSPRRCPCRVRRRPRPRRRRCNPGRARRRREALVGAACRHQAAAGFRARPRRGPGRFARGRSLRAGIRVGPDEEPEWLGPGTRSDDRTSGTQRDYRRPAEPGIAAAEAGHEQFVPARGQQLR